MKRLLRCAALVIAAVVSAAAGAQEWPSRPIRYMQPFQGLPDALARAYNDKVAATLKQPIVPEYKLGAAGRIALAEIAKAEPNGYVIGMATSGPLTIHPSLYQQLPYDEKSFAVLSILGASPMALAVPASSNIRSVEDLRKLSQTRELNIATGGVGGPHHLAAVLLQKTGVRALMVHFKSSAEVLPAMTTGAIDAYFDTVYQQDVFAKQGRYRAIAVTSASRMPQMPDVPTFAEIGHPEIDVHTFYATVAPAAMPQPILDRLAAAYAAAGDTPEVRDSLQKMALLPMRKPRAELEAMVRDARVRWKRVIDENQIRVE
jgi:tripartite-type tricarboxylate transporter receptor subunit TctC